MVNPRKPRQAQKRTKLKDVFSHLSPNNFGLHKDPVQKLYSALTKHFAPQDILEEIWLHDVARITADIELFRVVERSVHYYSLQRNLRELKRHGVFNDRELGKATNGIYHLTVGEIGASEMPSSETLAVVGSLSQVQIRGLSAISDVIQKLQRERDRIYAQFERKRRPLLLASVKTVESQVSAPSPADKLAE